MAERVVKSYRVLVGMEIHVQLATATKLFTACPNGAAHFGAEPNSLVDQQVLGLPGTLPVINKAAIELSIMAGLAMGCQIARHTKWDRKSYFYPDLPKNYQISQYDMPLCHDGAMTLDGHTIRIRRAHLEEDAGKLLHDAPGGYPIDWTIVDLNRAGTPLLEIVTEPDLTSGEQVAAFGQELQKLVQFLGVSEAQMQMGHMRFEPNINVHITDAQGAVHKTAITEIKNLNSFSVLQRATDYEIRRQIDQWVETGDLGRKATRGWDEATATTFLQREKEEAQDYRYFPDPDLLPVEVSEAWLTEIKARVGELPAQRRERYITRYELSETDAAILASDRGLGDYYEQVVVAGATPRRAANLILSQGLRIARERNCALAASGLQPVAFAQVATMIDSDALAASNAGVVLDRLAQTPDQDAGQVADALGLRQVSDHGAIDQAIDRLIALNPPPLKDFQSGKQAAMGALVGMVMKSAKGLNPKLVQQRLRERLGPSSQ